MDLKTIAMYLPQFHRTSENDKWWGEGFTDWIAVKKANRFYKEHNQPRVPLNKNYYNLLEHDIMVWQADLMKKYRVDGMCIYHYWFENGKRILEKPIENLLKWKEISMPFCFCWANETWSRTWKKLSGTNTWTSLFEVKNDCSKNGILLKQNYGREKEWEEHFSYLLPFFKDERYIKLEGKPVFVIFKPNMIFSLWDMMNLFNKLAKDNGFPGVYVIGMEEQEMIGLDAGCIRQPNDSMERYLNEKSLPFQRPMIYGYDELWSIVHKRKLRKDKVYLCGFVDYDNSPRMGKSGRIVSGASPQKFYKNFKNLYQKSLMMEHEFIFINAWNEWGESMYLEPDERYGYQYLEALTKVVDECKSMENIVKNGCKEIYEDEKEKTVRLMREHDEINRRHDILLDNWMHLRDIKVDFSKYFKKYGYQKIGIYGAGKLGIHLFYELKHCGIEVSFGIDRNYKTTKYPVEVYSPDHQIPEVDAIVITIIDQYGEISKMLSKKVNCPMIPLEEVIQELMFDT